MKKSFIILFSAIMIISAIPIYAYEYSFESGADSKNIFGNPTSNNELVPINSELTNVRRNKDAAHFPPAYGVFSGEIPTNSTSLYHNNTFTNSYQTNISSSSNNSYINSSNANNFISNANLPDSMLPSTSVTIEEIPTKNTIPLEYKDGSIGTLYIPKISKILKVYEGESLDNMKKGIGHFEITSTWDGNVGFAAHNRGASGYFSFVKDLKIGDKITYTTMYGVRNYEIFSKEKINETDSKSLGWTADNIITMITCVENQPSLRWSVQAKELI